MVEPSFTTLVRGGVTGAGYAGAMPIHPYLPDRSAVADAVMLIRDHGEAAAALARRRAHDSRSLGNHIHFCRWRQVARLIVLLADPEVTGTVH